MRVKSFPEREEGRFFRKTLNKEEDVISFTHFFFFPQRKRKTEERERTTLGSDLLFSHAHTTPIFFPASSRDLVSVRAKRALCVKKRRERESRENFSALLFAYILERIKNKNKRAKERENEEIHFI